MEPFTAKTATSSIWTRTAIATVFLLATAITPSNALDDWLVTRFAVPSTLVKIGPDSIRLTNGLVQRDFLVSPEFFTVDFFSLERGQSILRAVSPEALVNIDGLYYNVGGVVANIPRAYLNRTDLMANMAVDAGAFRFAGYRTAKPEAPFRYRPLRGAPTDIVWPPAGLRLDVDFRAPFWAPYFHQLVTITVHYEIYDGIPLISKWVSVTGAPEVRKKVEVFVSSVESMAVNWQWAQAGYGWLFVENDVPHTTVAWFTDPTQGSMPGSFQQNFNCTYPLAGLVPLADGFTSFRVHLLVVGSSDPERFGLAIRRKLRLLAPHTQENPIFFHMTSMNSTLFRAVIDQMADVGFEMLIYSFGSGFNMESNDPVYLDQMKADIGYANSKGKGS